MEGTRACRARRARHLTDSWRPVCSGKWLFTEHQQLQLLHYCDKTKKLASILRELVRTLVNKKAFKSYINFKMLPMKMKHFEK